MIITHRIGEELGKGQFGIVSRGVWESPKGPLDVAVKQLQTGASEEEKVKFLQEAAINGQFRHPNLVVLMGVITVGEPVSRVTCCVHMYATCPLKDVVGSAYQPI